MTADPDGAERLLRVSGYHLGRFRVVDLSGDCDIATEQVLGDGLREALADTAEAVIVDMSHVEFCDGASAGRILAAGLTHHLVVSGIGDGPTRVFDLLDPAEQVHRYPSIDLAAWSLAELP